MKIKSLLPWYGCKREQTKRILEVVGSHHSWWEPFAGSLALVLAKTPSRVEVVNDLHGGVINLAQVVQNDGSAVRLFERLNRTLFCEKLFEESRLWLQSTETNKIFFPCEEWAFHYFVFSWQARNGMAGTKGELQLSMCRRYTSGGGDPAVRFRNVVDSIPEWWQRLRGVTVLNQDGISLCERIEDKEGVVVYIDPPYLRKDCAYEHDFGWTDHTRLSDAVCRFTKTKVVVSYYQHEFLTELYLNRGFTLIDCSTKKKVSAVGRSNAPEVLLVKNGK